MFLEYSGNITSWLLEFVKRSTFVIIKSYNFNTKTTFPSRTFRKGFLLKSSLNVLWMSQTLQRWGNNQRIFSEHCVPAGIFLGILIAVYWRKTVIVILAQLSITLPIASTIVFSCFGFFRCSLESYSWI